MHLTIGSCDVGTLFVLVKNESPVDSLLAAIRDKETDRVKALVKELSANNPTNAPAKSDAIKGKWRLLWTEQASNANPLQKALSGQVRKLVLCNRCLMVVHLCNQSVRVSVRACS